MLESLLKRKEKLERELELTLLRIYYLTKYPGLAEN